MKLTIFSLFLVSFVLGSFAHEHHHGHHHGHHDHGHHHGGENLKDQAKFRYSKQANVQDDGPDFPSENHHEHHDHADEVHDHEHNHGHHEEHNHDHGHNHGHHEHNHGHDHGHDHHHAHGSQEEPKFKYSKQANEKHEHHGHSHGHDHGHEHGKNEGIYQPPTKKEPVFWFEPLLATLAISAAPFFILFIVPLNSNSPENQPFLKILLAFASGGLLGDAFLHLIPHAISPHAHDGSHSHSHSHNHGGEGLEESHDHTGDMIVGLWVLAGIIAFLVVEKVVRHIKGGHGHSHGPVEPIPNKPEESDKKNTEDKDKKNKGEKKEKKVETITKTNEDDDDDVKVSAYLNLAADCTHNFTDGLAIGASFLVSRNVGLITTLTIFLHEIPHEIGDFAILVQSGCTKRKAMMLQLVTAVGAFAGCICGLLAEGLGTSASSWILPFTAGGFIYIATVSVIPELLEESKLIQSLKEIFALLVGVFLMVLIALTE